MSLIRGDQPNYGTYSDNDSDSFQSTLSDDVPNRKEELKSLLKASVPLSFTFFFEYLLAVNSLFILGHLGSEQLAAAALAIMTFDITGMAVYEGMSTCLDTFCSQAYGAKKYYKVGLYFQRGTLMIMTLSVPILITWWFSKSLLSFIIPEAQLLDSTQLYLRILCLGSPALILFETAKRFLQSQKIFHAATYILMVALPVNVALNYFLINRYGFVGAPVAIVITYWIMACLVVLYIIFIDGNKCWGGFSKRALKRWRPMFALALPGLIMIEAEYLSFEILTIASSYFGTNSLAAQSIISNIGSLLYQVPFAVSSVISTRLAIYIGGGFKKSSKALVQLSFLISALLALLDFSVVFAFRYELTELFTSDPAITEIAVRAMPILAINQFGDTFNIIAASILRSQGRQAIGSYLNMISYCVIAMPLSFYLAFKQQLEINGLWIGLGIGIIVLGISESYCVLNSNWREILKDASTRDEDEYEYVIDDTSTDVSSMISSFSQEY